MINWINTSSVNIDAIIQNYHKKLNHSFLAITARDKEPVELTKKSIITHHLIFGEMLPFLLLCLFPSYILSLLIPSMVFTIVCSLLTVSSFSLFFKSWFFFVVGLLTDCPRLVLATTFYVMDTHSWYPGDILNFQIVNSWWSRGLKFNRF